MAIPADLLDHPRYRILECLGSGGMGTVFKAEHRFMGRLVALKVINPDLIDDPFVVDRFRQEIRAAGRLAHPNIVTAYDADQIGTTHFFVMEFVEGINLDQLAQEQEPFGVAVACEFARQAALGLQHSHERGMVHRDIKPRNLMLIPPHSARSQQEDPGEITHWKRPWGQVKILDFGLASFVSECLLAETSPFATGVSVTSAALEDAPTVIKKRRSGNKVASSYAIVGTADYLAPEESMDPHRADIRADIYSLGCTLFRFLTGRVPFAGGDIASKIRRHREETPTPVTELRPEVPATLAELVSRMMAKNPADRYPTPSAVARALAPFVNDPTSTILVVDDDFHTCQTMALFLESEGYRVLTAANGQEALNRLRSGLVPRLILLDLMMPVMDGWQFLQEQQKDPALATIPVVVVSATDQRQAQAAALGAAAFLHKPFLMGELAEKVQHLSGKP